MVVQKYIQHKYRTQSAFFVYQNVFYFCSKNWSTYHCDMQVLIDRCLYHPGAYLGEGDAIIFLYRWEHHRKSISGWTFKTKPLIFLLQYALFLIHYKYSETD